ncbi:hypothetical protein ACC759_37830, partial [Rhizobium ruizarguesonis]
QCVPIHPRFAQLVHDPADTGVQFHDRVGIPYFDSYVEKAAVEFLDEAAKKPEEPFYINVNCMKVHQPNMPAPEFEHKSLAKSKY